MQDLISVIIPIYNVEQYLERCVKSVQNQTFTNLEIILVDDGATDSSGAICDRLAESDRRIKVIHQENAGLACARNSGLEIYTGDYVCFIDSDDYIHPEYIRYLHRLCVDNCCKMAYCESVTTHEDSYQSSLDLVKPYVVFESHDLLNLFFGPDHSTIVVAWNKLIRRDVVGNVRFEPGIIHEDEATTFKFIYNAGRVTYTKNVLYYYFSREDSITGQPFGVRNLDILKGYENRLKFYGEKGETDLLRKEYAFYLSAILINYYKVSKQIDNNELILKNLKKRYRQIYNEIDKSAMPVPRRVIYAICLYFPMLYGRLRT